MLLRFCFSATDDVEPGMENGTLQLKYLINVHFQFPVQRTFFPLLGAIKHVQRLIIVHPWLCTFIRCCTIIRHTRGILVVISVEKEMTKTTMASLSLTHQKVLKINQFLIFGLLQINHGISASKIGLCRKRVWRVDSRTWRQQTQTP